MATRFVGPAATGSGNGLSAGSPWTVRQAGQNQAPGDIIRCLPGDYIGTPHRLDVVNNPPVNSGTLANPIRWIPDSGIVRFAERFQLPGVTDLRFEDVQWFTQGPVAWVIDSTASPMHRLTFLRVRFDSPNLNGGGAGFLAHGNDYVFRNCSFGDKFPNDMMSFFNGQRIGILDCDYSQARGGHCCFSFDNCQRVAVRRCFIRNNIARGGLCLWTSPGPGQKILIDHCGFIDCDYNLIDPTPLPPGDDGQAIRFSVERGIIRDSLFLHTNINNTQSNNAAIQFLLFNVHQRARLSRIYHNTILDSSKSAFALGRTSVTTTWDANLNRLLNNVMVKFANDGQSFAFKIGDNQVQDWKTWHVFGNIMWDEGTQQVIQLQTESPQERTVAQAEAAFPNVFQRNIQQQPTFVNESFFVDANGVPFPYDLTDLEDFFTNYRLAPASVGFTQGEHLAICTASTTGNTLTVNESMSFYDGYGIPGEVGDDILVGAEIRRITSVADDTHLVLDSPLVALSGTKIYLARTGRDPARGIFVPKPDEPGGEGSGGHGGHPRRASRRRVYYIPPALSGGGGIS